MFAPFRAQKASVPSFLSDCEIWTSLKDETRPWNYGITFAERYPVACSINLRVLMSSCSNFHGQTMIVCLFIVFVFKKELT